MTFERALLRARTIGVRKFRDNLSRFMRTNDMFVVTEHGNPTSVLLPYDDVMEIVDVLEELNDRDTVKLVAQGRRAISRGVKGISAEKVFKKDKDRG